MQSAAERPPTDPRDWSLGTSTSLFLPPEEDGLERAREAGITHVEVVIRAADPRPESRAPIVRRAGELGMTIHTVHLPFNWEWDISEPDPAAQARIVRRHLDILAETAAWGPRSAVIHPSYEPIPPERRRERLEACRSALFELGERAAALGIRLCVECLPRTCLGNTSAEVRELIDGNEAVAVCCDVNHLLQETPQAFIGAVGGRIEAVHISDYDGVDERHWVPGRGVIDWPAVVAALARAGFAGPFMFEVVSRKGQEPVDPHVLGEWWRRLLADRSYTS